MLPSHWNLNYLTENDVSDPVQCLWKKISSFPDSISKKVFFLFCFTNHKHRTDLGEIIELLNKFTIIQIFATSRSFLLEVPSNKMAYPLRHVFLLDNSEWIFRTYRPNFFIMIFFPLLILQFTFEILCWLLSFIWNPWRRPKNISAETLWL